MRALRRVLRISCKAIVTTDEKEILEQLDGSWPTMALEQKLRFCYTCCRGRNRQKDHSVYINCIV